MSPRLNLVYNSATNELRAAWGDVYQPGGREQFQVEDNVTTSSSPRARGIRDRLYAAFPAGLVIAPRRVRQGYGHLRPRFENLLDPSSSSPKARRTASASMPPKRGRAAWSWLCGARRNAAFPAGSAFRSPGAEEKVPAMGVTQLGTAPDPGFRR